MFRAHSPQRIRALPPIDRAGSDEGARKVRARVEEQLERRGYGSSNAGRTATMHVELEHWGRAPDGERGEETTCVRLSAVLYDDATGVEIWRGRGEAGCDGEPQRDDDGGWFDTLVSSAWDWAFDAATGDSARAADEAVGRLLRSLPRRVKDKR